MKPKSKKRKKSKRPGSKPARPQPKTSRSWLLALGLLAIIVAAVAVFLGKREKPLVLPLFDGEHAFALLEKQCAFGPRVPGTEAHRQCRAFLLEELSKYADHVVEQTFDHHIDRLDRTVTLTNLVADFNLNAGRRVLLAAHWDSRPWADEDPDSRNHDQPIPGANDGASGVAVLLEIARILKATPPPIGVDIVLFDGEDLGTPGEPRTYAIGSQYFARHKDSRYLPMFGILLDMVGDRDLQIYKEANSMRYASGIVDQVWGMASRLDLDEFMPNMRHEVFDDHVPLIEAGVPMIDLIDFDYSHWHTLADTPENCAAASLETVGKVVLAVLYNPDR